MASAWRLCLGRLCLVVGACAAVAPAVVPARGPMIHLADGRSLRLLALELRGETTPLRCHVETAMPSEPATPSELRGTAAPLRGDAEGARSAGGGAAGGLVAGGGAARGGAAARAQRVTFSLIHRGGEVWESEQTARTETAEVAGSTPEVGGSNAKQQPPSSDALWRLGVPSLLFGRAFRQSPAQIEGEDPSPARIEGEDPSPARIEGEDPSPARMEGEDPSPARTEGDIRRSPARTEGESRARTVSRTGSRTGSRTVSSGCESVVDAAPFWPREVFFLSRTHPICPHMSRSPFFPYIACMFFLAR